jgi:hypothetical protein
MELSHFRGSLQQKSIIELITAAEADTSEENNWRAETFTSGLLVDREQSRHFLQADFSLPIEGLLSFTSFCPQCAAGTFPAGLKHRIKNNNGTTTEVSHAMPRKQPTSDERFTWRSNSR